MSSDEDNIQQNSFFSFHYRFLWFINEKCTHCCINIVINFVKIEMW